MRNFSCRWLVLVLLVVVCLGMVGCEGSTGTPQSSEEDRWEAVPVLPTKTVIISRANRIAATYWFIENKYVLEVAISPNSQVIAEENYLVELYEKDILRTTGWVSWTQPELNVDTVKELYFPLSQEEGKAYCPGLVVPELSHIFSIKVIESQS